MAPPIEIKGKKRRVSVYSVPTNQTNHNKNGTVERGVVRTERDNKPNAPFKG